MAVSYDQLREGELLRQPADLPDPALTVNARKVLERRYLHRIDNRLEDGSDGIKRSWYMLTGGHEPRQFIAHRKKQRQRHTEFDSAQPKPKPWDEIVREREEKMREPEPSFELVP